MVSVSWYYPAVVTSGIVEWAASLCAGLSAVLRLSRDMVPPGKMFLGLLATGCVAMLPPVLGSPAGADVAQEMAGNFLAQTNGPRPLFHSWRRCTMQVIPMQNLTIGSNLQPLLCASDVPGSNRPDFFSLSASTREFQNASGPLLETSAHASKPVTRPFVGRCNHGNEHEQAGI